MSERKLFCYAIGRGDQWEAICVDFDLAIQGNSLAAVQEGLNAMIASYIEDAKNESEETAAQLLNRSAPLSVRLSLAAKLIWHVLKRRRDRDGDSYAGFDLPCHA